MSLLDGYSVYTGVSETWPDRGHPVLTLAAGENILASWATIVDCGDMTLTWLDNTVAFRQLDKAHRVRGGSL